MFYIVRVGIHSILSFRQFNVYFRENLQTYFYMI